MKKILLILYGLSVSMAFGQIPKSVNWVPLENLGPTLAATPKPIVFYLYYSECGLCGEEVEHTIDGKTVKNLRTVACLPCEKLEKEILTDKEVLAKTRDFHMVAFDASSEVSFQALGENFSSLSIPNPKGEKRMISRVHAFAFHLLGGFEKETTFPQLIGFYPDMDKIASVAGNMRKDQVISTLTFFKRTSDKRFPAPKKLSRSEANPLRFQAINQYLGKGKTDLNKANALFKQAYEANPNNPLTQIWLAIFHANGECNFETDLKKSQAFGQEALPFLASLQTTSKGEEKFLWAMAHILGIGMERDIPRGLALTREVADYGYLPALMVYADYLDATDDHSQAFTYYSQAAEQGVKGAMLKLGSYYQKGKGAEKDTDQAKEWYTKACELGDTKACEELAKR